MFKNFLQFFIIFNCLYLFIKTFFLIIIFKLKFIKLVKYILNFIFDKNLYSFKINIFI